MTYFSNQHYYKYSETKKILFSFPPSLITHFLKYRKQKTYGTSIQSSKISIQKSKHSRGGGVNAMQTFLTPTTSSSLSLYWKRGLATYSPLCPRKRKIERSDKAGKPSSCLPKKFIWSTEYCTVLLSETVQYVASQKADSGKKFWGSSKGLFWGRRESTGGISFFFELFNLSSSRTSSSSPANIWRLKKKRSGKKVVKTLQSDCWAKIGNQIMGK